MGAKYVPSIKDQKANRRFQQKQLVQSKFIKPAGPAPGRPADGAVQAPAPGPAPKPARE